MLLGFFLVSCSGSLESKSSNNTTKSTKSNGVTKAANASSSSSSLDATHSDNLDTQRFSISYNNQNSSCRFNGQSVQNGQSVAAYLNSSVPTGSSCVSEQRVCQNGTLSGSYSFASCTPGAAASCLFDGVTISHNSRVVAFLRSTGGDGEACQSQERVCSNGQLSGSYTFSSCQNDGAESCVFNDQTILNGQSVYAYKNSTVPFGSSCQFEERSCSNGILRGSNEFASCVVDGPAACQFSGRTLAHGESVVAFENSSVALGSSCVQQTRVCSNGTLSGTYGAASCEVETGASCDFNGTKIQDGTSIQAYFSSISAFGEGCFRQTRVCSNGFLSGAFTTVKCVEDLLDLASPNINTPPSDFYIGIPSADSVACNITAGPYKHAVCQGTCSPGFGYSRSWFLESCEMTSGSGEGECVPWGQGCRAVATGPQPVSCRAVGACRRP